MKTMKTQGWTYKFGLALALLLAAGSASGQAFDKSRHIREAFRIGPNVEVQVTNKYGDIHLVPWAKDSVVFEIDFTVTSKKQEKVDKIFDYVDFDFKSSTYYVIARTVFQGQNTFWTEVADMAGTIFSGGTTTRIDYTVYFPAGNDVKIENKFGNIYTTDHTGKVDITLSNGDMQAHAFLGPVRLKADFSNLSIDKITNGNLVLGYAELNLEEAGELNLEIRSSKFYLGACNKLHINSKRDRIYVNKVAEVTGDLYFSYLNLDKVEKKLNLRTNYGDIKVLDFPAGFQRMDVTSQYSDITVYLDREHLFDIQITRDEKSQVIGSVEMISKTEEPVEGQEKTYLSRVRAGKTGQPLAPVFIQVKSGKIYLMGK